MNQSILYTYNTSKHKFKTNIIYIAFIEHINTYTTLKILDNIQYIYHITYIYIHTIYILMHTLQI
jgi:hypothetical protein